MSPQTKEMGGVIQILISRINQWTPQRDRDELHSFLESLVDEKVQIRKHIKNVQFDLVGYKAIRKNKGIITHSALEPLISELNLIQIILSYDGLDRPPILNGYQSASDSSPKASDSSPEDETTRSRSPSTWFCKIL